MVAQRGKIEGYSSIFLFVCYNGFGDCMTEEMENLEYILNYFGIESQLEKLTEEAIEVFKAGIIYETSETPKEIVKRGQRNAIVEEIVDLSIVLDQIRLKYDIDIDEEEYWRKQKLQRTKQRINEGYYEKDRARFKK